jgi:putative selenate reductase
VDACNECGNCDVFCPEDGGPFAEKPRFHRTVAALRADRFRQGFTMARSAEGDVVTARFDGSEYRLEARGGHLSCLGPGFRVEFDAADPAGSVRGEAADGTDLTRVLVMDAIRRGILEEDCSWPGILATRTEE